MTWHWPSFWTGIGVTLIVIGLAPFLALAMTIAVFTFLAEIIFA